MTRARAGMLTLAVLAVLAGCVVMPASTPRYLPARRGGGLGVMAAFQPRPASTPEPRTACIRAPFGGWATVRACAGTACEPVAYAISGSQVRVLAYAQRRGEPWLLVRTGALRGWVWGGLVGACGGEP